MIPRDAPVTTSAGEDLTRASGDTSMRSFNVISSLALAAVLVVPATLHAQRNASNVPFRSGQWGAEFAASNDFQSLGMMRFFSPRRALAFDAQLENASTSIDG